MLGLLSLKSDVSHTLVHPHTCRSIHVVWMTERLQVELQTAAQESIAEIPNFEEHEQCVQLFLSFASPKD